jgi:hypothetical protein
MINHEGYGSTYFAAIAPHVNVCHGKESHDFTDLQILPLSHPMLTYVMVKSHMIFSIEIFCRYRTPC